MTEPHDADEQDDSTMGGDRSLFDNMAQQEAGSDDPPGGAPPTEPHPETPPGTEGVVDATQAFLRPSPNGRGNETPPAVSPIPWELAPPPDLRKSGKDETDEDVRRPDGASGAMPIALWGGAASGKSTLLGALGLAVQDEANGSWSIWPSSTTAATFIDDLQETLTRDLAFPEATITSSERLQFVFAGTLPPPIRPPRRWWHWGRARPAMGPGEQVSFRVELRDLPGGAFDLKSDQGQTMRDELVKDLATTRAMVYVLDPVRDLRIHNTDRASGYGTEQVKDTKQNSAYFSSILKHLTAEVERRDRREGQYLPHYLAVCITKFDDEEVFEFALDTGLVDTNPRTGQPQVTDGKRFFELLCEHFPQGGLDLIRRQINNYFAPDHIQFFVCSAVGFRPAEDGTVDFHNRSLVDQRGGRTMFVGPPRPIDVLEPFLFLRNAAQG